MFRFGFRDSRVARYQLPDRREVGGGTDGFTFFIAQRVVADPDAFLKYYARMIGRELNDPLQIQVLRSH